MEIDIIQRDIKLTTAIAEEGTRVLWMTDTFDDHNGVSMVLRSMLMEIRTRNLPIDILVCSSNLEQEDHLIVIKPLTTFHFPFYRQQIIRIPSFLEIRRIFIERGYDRIICSTEGPMGMAAIYLRRSFSVKTFFYLHTDWIMFARTALRMNKYAINQVQRLLRFYYKRYDGLFVLNTEQQEWLSGDSMKLDPSQVFLTAHWVDAVFYPRADRRKELFGLSAETPVMLFAGRLSREKGVMELRDLFQSVKRVIPGIQIVIAGKGPAEADLRESLPEAIFLGWVDHESLPEIYSSVDILVLPSRFDTFSCVVLEALSCGLPVVAYDSKGPRDIIEHRKSGMLVTNSDEMCQELIRYFSTDELCLSMKKEARIRSGQYDPGTILHQFISDIGLRNAG